MTKECELLIHSCSRASLTRAQRLLARCHAMGNDDPSHPSNRQILYEGKKYTAQKVKDFSSLLKGLQAADQIPEAFANVELSSGLLTNLVSRREEEVSERSERAF